MALKKKPRFEKPVVAALFIQTPEAIQFKVMDMTIVDQEILIFTADGLYVATRKGCVKLGDGAVH